MADVGRPTELTEELLVKIKDGIFEGKNHKEIAEDIGIPYDTYMGWKKRNYDNFDTTIITYEQERRLRKAERNLDSIMDVQTDDPKMKDVVAKVTMFVAETLGRTNYHKKKELDAKGEFRTFEIIDEKPEQDSTEVVPGADSAVAKSD